MTGKIKLNMKAAIVTLTAFAILVGLGIWQMQRLEWKNALVAGLESQMAQKPAPLPERIDQPETWQYRRVSMAGSFLHDKRFLIGPRTREGRPGYHLIVPFQRVSGGFVFVNRGWVSDETLPRVRPVAGLVQVDGVAIVPERTGYTPDNEPSKNQWYWADIEALAKAAGLPGAAPLLVQVTQTPADAVPAGVPVAAEIRNDHRQYAFFWFGMAAVLLVVFFVYHWQENRNGSVQTA